MQKHNTRENVHSGLSVKKEDQKWNDMLNFRSSDNRTFVVPRKCKIFEDNNSGLHTVLRGAGDDCYALGSKASWKFQPNDVTAFLRVWRARVEQKLVEGSQADALHLRGSFTGSEGKTIRVTVVKTRLSPDVEAEVVVLDPEVITPPPPINPLCPLIVSGLTKVNVLDSFGAPLARAALSLYDGRDLLQESLTTPGGLFSFTASNKTLRLRVTDSNGRILDTNIPPCQPEIEIQFPEVALTLTVTINFYVYGSLPSASTEDVEMVGSIESGVFTGVNSKGPFTLQWVDPHWEITFDSPVATTGDGDILPFHTYMEVSGIESRYDPSGFYVQIDAAPFPNWTAVVPVTP